MYYHKRKYTDSRIIIYVCIICAIVGYNGFMIYRSVHNSFTQTEVTARVVDAVTKQVGNEGRWFVYIQPVEKTEADTEYTDVGDPLVVEVSDTYLYGKFNSSDRFFELKQHIGTIYHFTLQGERNAFWSTWQNIVEYTPVSQ